MDIRFSDKSTFNQWYMSAMKPVLFKEAVFSDTSENYISPAEPNPYGEVTIKLRTARNNVESVYLVTPAEEIPMEVTQTNKTFDFYSCKVFLNDSEFLYYFKIKSGRVTCNYDAGGIFRSGNPRNPFSIIPGFHTPDWAKGAVMYQIYTERFNNGDPTNDVEDGEYWYVGGPVQKITDWNKAPAVDGTKEFYGGDLQGVIDKLDYLKDLGVEAIYFNPLFVSPSNHKYDSQDYEHIDPHFGRIVEDGGECLKPGESDNKLATKYIKRVSSIKNLEASDALFCELVKKAHERGMKVILDGVFNHCGSFNKWMDRERIYEGNEDYGTGAYISKDSPYVHYFDFRNSDGWPNNGNYDGWWGYDTLPKLNYEASEELFGKIIDIARKWVSEPFCADGWRLDVAADLGHSQEFNHKFFKRFRDAVKQANPEALILAEHYGDPKPWLNGFEWDSVMNYDAFMEPVTWFLTGMQKHSDDFRPDMIGNSRAFFDTMKNAESKFFTPSKLVAMNQLSNHDHSRFLTRTNCKVGRTGTLGWQEADSGVDKAVMRLAVMIQMTWTGAPTIYYGDEAGLTGFTDPDNRRTYPWGKEDWELISFHKEMIKIHRDYPEIKHGSIMELVCEQNVIAYARFTEDECTGVVINRDSAERYIEIPIWKAVAARGEGFEKIMLSTKEGFSTDRFMLESGGGKVKVKLSPVSGMVFRKKRK